MTFKNVFFFFRKPWGGTEEHYIFLHFFFVPHLWCETCAKKRARGTEEPVKTFKVFKESQSGSPFPAPRATRSQKEPTSTTNAFKQQQKQHWPFPSLALNWGPGIPWPIIDDSSNQNVETPSFVELVSRHPLFKTWNEENRQPSQRGFVFIHLVLEW